MKATHQPAPASADGPAQTLSWWLLLLSVVMMFTLSASTLAYFDLPYDRPGGSMLVKLHPSTYALTLAWLLALIARGNPIAVAIEMARELPLGHLYLGCMLFVAAWGLWQHGSSGAAFFVDSLWMPAFAQLTLHLQSRRRQRSLLVVAIVLLALNSALALLESAAGQATIVHTYGLDGVLPDVYFRASALLGHPLANALITASLLPAIFVVRMSWVLRLALLVLFGLAMLAFGGRAALVTSLAVYASAAAVALSWRALQGGFSYRQWAGGLLLGFLTLGGLFAVVQTSGLGERFFANLVWDGSAKVRMVAFDALDLLDALQWFTGVSHPDMELIMVRLGLDPKYEAIENPWIGILMQLGILGFLPFLFGLACGVASIWRFAPGPMQLGIAVYFLVGSSANTLSSKTVSLTLLFIAAQCAAAFRPASPAPVTAAGRSWSTPLHPRMT